EQVTAGHMICTGLMSSYPLDQWYRDLRSMLRSICSLCEEHCFLCIRAPSHVCGSPISVSGQSPSVSSEVTSRGVAVIQAHPMPGRVAVVSSWMIRTLEPSVKVIFPATSRSA
ncbi:putative molybdopterin oxidoreductase, partial [Trichinella spiralis]|uniref:putative molybdopterin oxidoreductase n=1 Tax=Trichinella spiralis TaxID=6334 RepID=UPI0001EFD6A8